MKIVLISNHQGLKAVHAEQKFANVHQTFVRYFSQRTLHKIGYQFNQVYFHSNLQLRLDFNSFVINGPSTSTLSATSILGGQVI